MKTLNEAYFDLYMWQYSNTDSFSNKLFSLIGHADMYNIENIRKGFPHEVAAWEEWYRHDDPDDFLLSIKTSLIDKLSNKIK